MIPVGLKAMRWNQTRMLKKKLKRSLSTPTPQTAHQCQKFVSNKPLTITRLSTAYKMTLIVNHYRTDALALVHQIERGIYL
jgi:hypothetical protein